MAFPNSIPNAVMILKQYQATCICSSISSWVYSNSITLSKSSVIQYKFRETETETKRYLGSFVDSQNVKWNFAPDALHLQYVSPPSYLSPSRGIAKKGDWPQTSLSPSLQTWGLWALSLVSALLAAASAVGLLVSTVRAIINRGRSLLTHCRFPDVIGSYSYVTNECPFDPTRIYVSLSAPPVPLISQ